MEAKFAESVRVEDPKRTPEHTEYHFTIDGEEFPWYISEHGLTVTRLHDDIYTVGIEIFLLDKERLYIDVGPVTPYLPFGYTHEHSSVPNIPVIDGHEFPWLLTEDGWTLECSHKMVPTLRLAFLANDVSGDVDIDDKRPEKRAVWGNGGDLWRDGAEQSIA